MAQKRLLVEKCNILNDIIMREFTLQELRLFSIYLSRIDARDPATRVVKLKLRQFYQVMGLHPTSIEYMKAVTQNLLTKVVCLPDPNKPEDYVQLQLFKRCTVDVTRDGNEYFFLEAHDDTLPLMFEYKRDYFTYDLWNVLNLQSVNQFRMYEILKEYEHKGERVILVDDLKGFLGIGESEYAGRWDNFKHCVLNPCQAALKEHTDITFTWEPYTKAGLGGKITSLKFTIMKNEAYVDKLDLAGFLDLEGIRDDIKQSAEDWNTPDPAEAAVSGLNVIREAMPDQDRQAFLNAAGYEELIRGLYNMARQQGGIINFIGWMVNMLKKTKAGGISRPVSTEEKNKFCDCQELEYEQFKKAVSSYLDAIRQDAEPPR